MIDNNLQSVVSVLAEIAKREDCVVWIRTPNYRKQLYVSPAFEKIWGRNADELYKHPWRFGEFLIQDEFHQKMQEPAARDPASSNSNKKITYFRIQCPDNKIKYLRDRLFHFYDKKNMIFAIGGLTTLLTKEQWENEVDDQLNSSPGFDESTTITQILNAQTKDTSQFHLPDQLAEHYIFSREGETIDLTEKEMQCLGPLINGLTAKDIARKLNISHRTVEKHIDSIKVKLGCRNKSEIYKRIHPTSFNSIYLQNTEEE